MKLAIAGDAILTRPVSQIVDPRATAMFDLLRQADLAFLNCETVLHDYKGPGVYAAAEAGMVAMRSPTTIARELGWLNARLVATANNHSLDYSAGGLAVMHATLEAAGIAYAGTGDMLAEARAAAYVDCPDARVALVSMSTTASREARASDPFGGVVGRPGLNPLGYHFEADQEAIDRVVEMATKFGLWVCQVGPDLWEVNPPGMHMTVTRYYVSDRPGCRMVLDTEDVAGNLNAIRNAKAHADIAIAHVHNHEWDTVSGSLRIPAEFMPPFARAAIDAGADVVVAQGSHAPIRGIEIHNGKPIFYDTGDFFVQAQHISRFPREYYARHSAGLRVPIDTALPVDGTAAMGPYFKPHAPAGGYFGDWHPCGAVAVLEYAEGALTGIALHPFTRDPAGAKLPAALAGVPLKPSVEEADDILGKFASLSEAFGTKIAIKDGIGRIVL